MLYPPELRARFGVLFDSKTFSLISPIRCAASFGQTVSKLSQNPSVWPSCIKTRLTFIGTTRRNPPLRPIRMDEVYSGQDPEVSECGVQFKNGRTVVVWPVNLARSNGERSRAASVDMWEPYRHVHRAADEARRADCKTAAAKLGFQLSDAEHLQAVFGDRIFIAVYRDMSFPTKSRTSMGARS